jgi:hypothetical protein
MALLDTVRGIALQRAILKSLRGIEAQLTRLATAAEQAHPPLGTVESIEVETVDPDMMARYEVVSNRLQDELGREPTAEEILDRYDQLAHLMPPRPGTRQ